MGHILDKAIFGVTCKCYSESHLLSSTSSVSLCSGECSGRKKKKKSWQCGEVENSVRSNPCSWDRSREGARTQRPAFHLLTQQAGHASLASRPKLCIGPPRPPKEPRALSWTGYPTLWPRSPHSSLPSAPQSHAHFLSHVPDTCPLTACGLPRSPYNWDSPSPWSLGPRPRPAQ